MVHSLNPLVVVRNFWLYRHLIWEMIKREVIGRYRGSVLGILWSLFHPLLMLTIYTFVFSVVFRARWGEGEESKVEFALILFSGLIVFNLFAECINRAPSLVLGNVNYVKKVVFPLEILPWVTLGAALFHCTVSLAVLLVYYWIVAATLPWTVIFIPAVLAPLLLLTVGFSWFLASLGVFLRDVSQTIGVLTTVLMFLSPIFYPVAALPSRFQTILYLNPLTFIIEQMRAVTIFGRQPHWSGLFVITVVGIGVAWLGFLWFVKTRKGFADVL